jgi:hypothetical protein
VQHVVSVWWAKPVPCASAGGAVLAQANGGGLSIRCFFAGRSEPSAGLRTELAGEERVVCKGPNALMSLGMVSLVPIFSSSRL